MRNAHRPEGPHPYDAAQDYRRMSNEEMWNRLGIPRVDMDKVALACHRERVRIIEHNCASKIRRAIFQYLEEAGIGE